jgi:hypothetical protein
VRIGIVTPAYNVAPYIGDTIRSVLDQTHRDWTMVVVDDGSTDDTASVVQGFRDPRLRLVSQANVGVSVARNRGATEADCDAMLFLDGDDRLAPFALDVLAQALTDAPDAVAAVGAYERGGRVYPPASGDIRERLLVRNLFVNGGHVLVRREAVRPFREDLRYGEDWEFWVRLSHVMACESPSPTTCPAKAVGRAPSHAMTWKPRFAAALDPRPILHVRERPSGAYLRMATDPASFAPCLDAIHGNPALAARFSADKLVVLRRRAEAEVQWTIGRELIRHRRYREGLRWLGRSLATEPNLRRAALLAAIAVLPPRWRGPLYPYERVGSMPCFRIAASAAGDDR